MTVAKVRDLIEHTALTYEQITAQDRCLPTAPSRAGRATEMGCARSTRRAPGTGCRTYRASRRLKLRKLAGRLQAIAERYVRELEETPGVDVDRLMQALQVLRMARLEAMGNRRRRRPGSAQPQTGRGIIDANKPSAPR